VTNSSQCWTFSQPIRNRIRFVNRTMSCNTHYSEANMYLSGVRTRMSAKELGEETNDMENCQSAYVNWLDVKSVWEAQSGPTHIRKLRTTLTRIFGCIGYPTFGFFFRLPCTKTHVYDGMTISLIPLFLFTSEAWTVQRLATRWKARLSNPGAGRFFSSQNVQTFSGAHPTSNWCATRFFPGGKVVGT